jgi:hypothetical protein
VRYRHSPGVQVISCIPLILVFLLPFVLAPAVEAAVALSSGGSQEIPVGSPSEEIGFKVIDELGHPDTGAKVVFTLVDPTGQSVSNGLSTALADTDDSGQVFTHLNAVNMIGIYTITATLLTDATQFASTYIIVSTGIPASLSLISGNNQSITVGDSSADLTFRVTDTFGNPLMSLLIRFTVKTPTGEITSQGLLPRQANTDAKGEVSTRLEAVETEGEYTVIATLDTDNQVVASAIVSVTTPLPNLPSLGFGGALSASGVFLDSDASFYGGIATNGNAFEPEAVLNLNDSVAVEGVIKADSGHVGETADILVVAGYKPNLPTSEEWYYMLDQRGNYQKWDGQMANLDSFKRNVTLSKDVLVKMYGGKFIAEGQLKIYFGYRLPEGMVVFNGDQTINVLVKK